MQIRHQVAGLALVAGLFVASCATSDADQPLAILQPAPKPPAWRSALSSAGSYSVAWRPTRGPIRIGEPFQIEFRVTDKLGQALPEEARIFPDAAMPMHGHGMTRRPVSEAQPDGSYLARGLLLHMAGDWLFSFDIQAGPVFERASFQLTVGMQPSTLKVDSAWEPDILARILELSPLPPTPADPTNAVYGNPAAAHFGQFLFFDERFSVDGSVSCASCHLPDKQWGDAKLVAEVRVPLERNTPTLWNVAHGRWFFWGGRADSLWAQALGPLEDPREHGGDRLSYTRLIHSDDALRAAYGALFGELPDLNDTQRFPPAARPVLGEPEHPLQLAWQKMASDDQEAVTRVFVNLGKSIAAYERNLISGDAAFDRYVRGLREDDASLRAALSASARRGLGVFLGKGACHNCHSGPNFSDGEFHNTRLPKVPGAKRDGGRFSGLQKLLSDPFQGKGRFADSVAGRQAAAEKLDFLIVSGDSFAEFKTPTLRNVAKTGPYMHSGQFETLEDVIEFYSDQVSPANIHAHQERVLRPARLSSAEKADLLAFLEALGDDKLPTKLLAQPASPKL